MSSLMEEYLRSQQDNLDNRSVVSGSDIDGKSVSELKQLVAKWSEVEANIKRMRRNMQAWNITKKDLEGQIIKFMKENDFDKLNTKEALIECKTRTAKKKPSKAAIKDKLFEIVKDQELYDQVADLIFSPGEVVGEKTSLKRTVF